MHAGIKGKGVHINCAHLVKPSAAMALSGTCGSFSGCRHQLAQPGIPGCYLPQLLQLQEGLNMPAALLIHLRPPEPLVQPLWITACSGLLSLNFPSSIRTWRPATTPTQCRAKLALVSVPASSASHSAPLHTAVQQQ